MNPPVHHKELAQYLKGMFSGLATVTVYRDEYETKMIPIGAFERSGGTFYSTIGACDKRLVMPKGRYEFAAIGSLPWLPNAIASSVFWAEEHSCESWPLVCEDVVRSNTRSTYRHMVYTPSVYSFMSSSGIEVHWLLGVPIVDAKLSIEFDEAVLRARDLYPDWLFLARV